jgi:hypothetical protein
MTADPRDDTQIEIAAAAARLIADDGLDYASAKRRAAGDVLGGSASRRALPDNALIEIELRRYLATFGGDRHRQQLAALRSLALDLMERLAAFDPHLVGAVLNGTATVHSDIHLHLYTDSAKDVELFLMEHGIDYEADDPGAQAGDRAAPSEELRFVVPARAESLPARIGVVLSVHDRDAIRVAPRHRSAAAGLHPVEASGRAGRKALRELLAATPDAA